MPVKAARGSRRRKAGQAGASASDNGQGSATGQQQEASAQQLQGVGNVQGSSATGQQVQGAGITAEGAVGNEATGQQPQGAGNVQGSSVTGQPQGAGNNTGQQGATGQQPQGAGNTTGQQGPVNTGQAAPTNTKGRRKKDADDDSDDENVKKKQKTGSQKNAADYKGAWKKALGTRVLRELSDSDVNRLVPRNTGDVQYDEDWTQRDEVDLRQAWADDPNRRALLRITENDHIKMWKTMLRWFRCSPAEIVSAKYRLEYDPSSHQLQRFKNEDGSTESIKPLSVSRVFCKRLSDLAFHPNWLHRLPLFVYGMQYAVILRTNDRRTWYLTNETNEPFWNVLIQVIYEKRGQNVSMHDTHAEARRRLRQANMPRPHFSRFMSKLEEMFPVEMFDAAEAPGPFDPYRINSTDLFNIENALTAMEFRGLPIYGGTQGTHWGELVGKNLMPCPDKDTIRDFHERGILVTRRMAGRALKRRTRLGVEEPPMGKAADAAAEANVGEVSRADYDAKVADYNAKVAEVERLRVDHEA
ncbi:hypothetical protein CSIM01_02661 [Colletotrichum simmondsii]|uniref:Uncharacterized protein n=1 Tax=Colletotrichum simmondsii TaxID=703756 RepID=A0A135RV98_9PEZI|nr:hypothetical protein CSIM01_02661 [Colletotrichum simmondsii]